MKKSEVILLLEYKKNLINSRYGEKTRNQYFDILDYELPKIMEMEEELSILQKELDKIKSYKKSILDYLEKNACLVESINCTHQVLFSYPNVFGSLTYNCALCGKDVSYDNMKERVVIPHDFRDEDGDFYRRYNFGDLYEIIMNMLKDKENDEEINFADLFAQEFQAQNIGRVTIKEIEYKKVYNILVLGGSNKIKIAGEIFLKKGNLSELSRIIEYLASIYRFKVTLISSEELKNYAGVKKRKYLELEELQKHLEEVRNTDFDLVIDATDLFEYEIKDNKISILPVSLNLASLFPNSLIFDLKIREKEREFYKLLQELILNNNTLSNDFKRLLSKK